MKRVSLQHTSTVRIQSCIFPTPPPQSPLFKNMFAGSTIQRRILGKNEKAINISRHLHSSRKRLLRNCRARSWEATQQLAFYASWSVVIRIPTSGVKRKQEVFMHDVLWNTLTPPLKKKKEHSNFREWLTSSPLSVGVPLSHILVFVVCSGVALPETQISSAFP